MKTLCACIDQLFAENGELARRFPKAPAAWETATQSLIRMVADRPAHDFTSGLRSTVDWMLANEDWWPAILDDSYRDWIEDNYAKR